MNDLPEKFPDTVPPTSMLPLADMHPTPPDRDPALDHFDELHPRARVDEDLSDVVTVRPDGPPIPVRGANVDDAGVAHFLRISSASGVPDMCGGCEKDWPCGGGVPLTVSSVPDTQ